MNHRSRRRFPILFASFLAFATSSGRAIDAREGPPASTESFENAPGGPRAGRIVGDAVSGFRFESAGGESRPLEVGSIVAAKGSGPGPAEGLAPFRVRLGSDQQVSGRLESVDDRAIRIGSGDRTIVVERSGAQSLLQRPGEAQVLAEGFEMLDTERWGMTGAPELVRHPRLAGDQALALPAGGASLTYRLPAPIGSGRLDVAFLDEGLLARGQSWFVDLAFAGPSGAEPIRAVLGWDGESLAVQSPRGPALAIQRLARKPGWHRLAIRFGPGGTELSVDGAELAHGNGPAGHLIEVRLASHADGTNGAPEGLAAYLDDLRLARFAEPVGSLEIDPDQDELRLVGGDQLFGQLRAAGPERLTFMVDGREVELDWSEVASVHLRRAPEPSEPIGGLWVRADWQADGGGEADRIEGALTEVSGESIVLDSPSAGMVTIPRDRFRRLEVLSRGIRIVLDPTAHHLGNEIFPSLDPPQPEGGVLERTFDLDRIPDGPAAFALDVIQVAGEAAQLPFGPQVRNGELRTTLILNGQEVDYLNRHVTTKNESPRRVRLPIPAGLLRVGPNRLRIEQAGEAHDEASLDDLGVLGIAVEFEDKAP